MAERAPAAALLSRLAELRSRLIGSVLFWIAASVAVYAAAPLLIEHMTRPLPQAGELFFLSPAEAFVSRVKLALAGGLLLSVPVLLYQLVRFAAPLLPSAGRRTAFVLVPLASALFAGGAALGYQALLPVALRFLLRFAGPELVPMLSLAAYIRFVLWLVLPTGLVFQLPVVITFLARLGLVDARAMSSRRKYAVLGIFMVSAVLTPADVFSMFLMALPLWLLYEISLLIARCVGRPTTSRTGRQRIQ